MQDQIRRAIIDLTLLSQTLSCSERIRVLETVNRFRNIVEEDDPSISLYEQLFSKSSRSQREAD
jgi:hypothetical protein